MRLHRMLKLFPTALVCATLAISPALADDRLDKATTAVTGTLFEHDADEFSTYRIRNDGFAEVTFASNTPDALYSKILDALRKHPDINGVIAGRGGPACRRF